MSDEAATEENAPPSEKVGAIMESIKGLSVMELVELKDVLEDEFGVSAAAMPIPRAPRFPPHARAHLLRTVGHD